MKKKILLFLIIFNFTLFAKYDDFELFVDGCKFYQIENYKKTEDLFNTLIKDYPESILLKSHYAQHFIAMNYFKLEEYEKAISFFEKAEYIPEELKENGYFKGNKKDFFQYKNEYFIGEAYEKLGEWEKAQIQYEKLLKPYFEVELEEYTKKALKKLSTYQEEYQYIYNILFEGNFENITELSDKHIIYIADYFFSKGLLAKSEMVYKIFLFNRYNYDIELKLLETLTREKKYEEVIFFSQRLLKEKKEDAYYFYLGNAYRRQGSFFDAIDTLIKIKEDSSFYSEANYILGRLYTALGNKIEAIEYLKKSNSWLAIELIAKIYYDLGEEDNYKKLLDFLKDKEWWDFAGEYRYKLYQNTQDKNYLWEIIEHNPNTYYYELAGNILGYEENHSEYNLDELNNKYEDLNKLLDYLSQFDDKNLSKIAINQYEFDKEDIIYKIYLRIRNYINLEDYYNAVNLAIKNTNQLYRYSNLQKYVYPEYYKDYVEKWSWKYDIDKALVYSIIRQESHFNKDAISKASAYGLMQLIIPTAQTMNKNIEEKDLLNPKENIKYGTMYIGRLMEFYDESISTSVAAYNGGPGNLSKWKLDENGNIVIDSISFSETKKYVERVMNNYYKYKRIYGE
jgi:soluble lytic murein transglycosylase